MIDFYLDEDYELVYTSFGTGTKMNKQDLQYCSNCFNAVIMYNGGYYCWCRKHRKEVGFYDKPCKEYK